MRLCGIGIGQVDIELGRPDLPRPCDVGLDDVQVHSPTKVRSGGTVLINHLVLITETSPFVHSFCLQQIKSLGNMALQAHVFEYLLSILKSPYFAGDRVSYFRHLVHWCVLNPLLHFFYSPPFTFCFPHSPPPTYPLTRHPYQPVANLCKCVIHTLLSLCVSTFNEESLGNPQVSMCLW